MIIASSLKKNNYKRSRIMEKRSLSELIQQTQIAMQRLNYSDQIMRYNNKIFKEVIEFAASIGEKEFSEPLGERFLLERYNYPNSNRINDMPYRTTVAARAIRKLSEYQLYGGFYRKRASRKTVDWAMEDIPIIKAFIKKMSNRDTVEKTKITNLFRIQKFYDFLHSAGVTSISGITVEILSAYSLSMQGDAPRYAQDKITTLRHYLRYLYNNGHIESDFSKALPRISTPRNKNIPAIWDEADVDKLLRSVDRSSPAGKRDYAIFVLTTGLGLRAADINNLQLSNLNWSRKEIEVSQQKTGKINVFPMTDEVGWALIDYLRYGRPQSDQPYVFLTANAPYTKFGDVTATSILKRYMQRCGIHENVSGISKGMHSLRHSLARKLLDKDTPLELIANIMGHTQIVSSSPYLKIDINGLRECALSLEEVKRYATPSNS
jgi:site-specific recombinase XerD